MIKTGNKQHKCNYIVKESKMPILVKIISAVGFSAVGLLIILTILYGKVNWQKGEYYGYTVVNISAPL